MKAVHITEFNGPDGVELKDVPPPRGPKGHQILVKVSAAGLNRADLIQARGLYPPPKGYSPNLPGLEFAGEIIELGDKATRFTRGTRVFGIVAGEAQKEYLLTDERLVVEIPQNLSFVEAAAIPEAFITAHDAIFTLGGLTKDSRLLIHAVGSGVGLAALQLAKAAGATVIGTSRTADKLERCDELGLDAGILTGNTVDFSSAVLAATNDLGANVILELVGAAYFEQDLKCLAEKGRVVIVGLTSGRRAQFDLGIALQKRATIVGTVLRPRSLDEKIEATRLFSESVMPLLASGQIVPNIDRVFPIENVVDAYKFLDSNESFGKVILEF